MKFPLLAALLLLPGTLLAAPTITTTSPLPGSSLSTAYSQTLAASGGTAPYTWTVSAGALPAGLTLSAAGVLSGTPTATGVFNFTAQVTDAVPEMATKAFALTVYLTTSANGFGIPHPSSATTYPVVDGVNTIQVLENMVYVPGGTFTYGTGATATIKTIDGYCLNRFEVTNAEYKAFLTATGSTAYPSYWTGGNYPAGRGNHCILYISLTRANAYAAWVAQQTGRIVVVPSAPEWERAARGPSAYLYPWGNTFGATYSGGVLTAKSNYNGNVSSYYLTNFGSSPAIYNNLNSTHYNQVVTVATIAGYDASDNATPFAVTATGGVNGYVSHTTYTGFIYTDVFGAMNSTGGFTTPVGSYPTGVNAYGSYDLAGNAYEWTSSIFIATNGAEAGQYVNQIRGGGWYSNGSSGQTVDIGEGRSATGAYNSVGFRIAMLPVPAVSTVVVTTASPLAAGYVGTAYSLQLAADGGSGFFAWTVAGGTLPAGLTLNTTGVLAGTPTATGSFNFTARATDPTASTATKAFTVTISGSPVTITTASPLPAGTVASAYSQTLAASGGTAPYTWTVAAGTLPTGLTLSTAGVLSGTPTAGGSFNFTVQAADAASATTAKVFDLSISSGLLSIASTSPLAAGLMGAAYNVTLAATGGATPYTWSLNSGSLPAGLTLSAAGVISGTPTAAGTSNFTVQVADSLSVIVTKFLVITIAAFGPLHHFTWDYVPASVYANTPSAARLTARDAGGNLVTTYNGGATLSASAGVPLPSPVVITEVTDEQEDQFELQNVSSTTANTAGWYVRIGDSITNTAAGLNTVNATTYNLPPTVAPGAILRVTESSTDSTGGRTYFGSAIAWSTSPANSRGWVMLFDNTNTLRDFSIFYWTLALSNLDVTINGTQITSSTPGLWSGAAVLSGTRPTPPVTVTVDSYRRIGTSDNHTAADWAWTHNADNTDATSFGATNPGLTVPWASGTPLTVAPTSVILSGGEYLGYLTLGPTATNAILSASDSSSHTGNSAAFNILAAASDTDGDGIPDAWETTYGLNSAVADSGLDSDGDGASNLDEFRAGTDPQNPASRFAITGVDAPGAGQFAITWPGVMGRLYRVSSCTDLATWTPLAPLVLATSTGPQTANLSAGGRPSLFLRVEILPLP